MVKYSATISATDSVAALTLIKPSEYPKLFSIIFGEGMVNDAVAIILFKVVGTSHWIQEEYLTALARRRTKAPPKRSRKCLVASLPQSSFPS